ncbi:restriction endonuclease subunit S, partial [Aeromonas rivipollensis]|uniref:restriction endonuclease subunit S n=1 Tax=Aeromonas rivipollensis TaxID=948519 RepID=UPI003D22E26B
MHECRTYYLNSRYTHDGEFTLIGRQGALCGNVQYVTGQLFASEHAIVASPTKGISTKWLSIYLERMNLNQYSESSAQPGLSAEKLRVLKLITPTSEEQTA